MTDDEIVHEDIARRLAALEARFWLLSKIVLFGAVIVFLLLAFFVGYVRGHLGS